MSKLSEYKTYFKNRSAQRAAMDEAVRTAQVKGYGIRKLADMRATAANKVELQTWQSIPKGLSANQRLALLQRADARYDRKGVPKALTQGKMLGPSKASVKKERAAQDREDRKAEKAYEKKTRGSQGGGKDQPRDEIGRWS